MKTFAIVLTNVGTRLESVGPIWDENFMNIRNRPFVETSYTADLVRTPVECPDVEPAGSCAKVVTRHTTRKFDINDV